MPSLFRLHLVVLVAPALAGMLPAQQSARPPVAEIRPKVDTLHGQVRVDNYFYMRDRKDPKVIQYLDAENGFTDAMTKHTKALEDSVYDEILGRIKQTDLSVPVKRGPFFYYTRTVEGKSYPIFARKRGSLDASEEVIYDQNEEAKPYRFLQLGGFTVSPDHSILAVLVDTSGYEDFELRFRDLKTGKDLPERVSKLGFGLAWASDNKTIFYARTDSAKRNDAIWRHVVGTPTDRDERVYHDPDVLFNVSVSRLRSGQFIQIESGSFTSCEVHVLDAERPDAPLRTIVSRTPGVECAFDHSGDSFYLLTNANGQRNFALLASPVSDPQNWKPVVPYVDSVFTEDLEAFRDHLILSQRMNGLRQLVVYDLASKRSHRVSFDEAAYGVFPAENPEFDTNVLRFSYSSLVRPSTVYDYDVKTRTRKALKQEEVLGGYDPSKYQVERLYATARDGAKVPISLVYRKPFARDGARPTLLYAYGSYGATTEPTFNSQRFSLIDRGFVYAIAHVRGGQEMGRSWYDDGKMMKKKNTFFDFIDVADHLLKEKYTSRDRLVANGGSAGGLLMGAVHFLGGDRFRAIVADVPFVDVINTMMDASIPLTAQEWQQWGNPNKPDEYAYMMSYSPYDNVERRRYPALLVTSGLNDSRVPYWEPAKWVAKLRAFNPDGNLMLLKMNMGGGHGGSSGRYERYREQAFRFAFMIDQVRTTVQ
jgi:oligopeptidase B